jgi:hypothetical protein
LNWHRGLLRLRLIAALVWLWGRFLVAELLSESPSHLSEVRTVERLRRKIDQMADICDENDHIPGHGDPGRWPPRGSPSRRERVLQCAGIGPEVRMAVLLAGYTLAWAFRGFRR